MDTQVHTIAVPFFLTQNEKSWMIHSHLVRHEARWSKERCVAEGGYLNHAVLWGAVIYIRAGYYSALKAVMTAFSPLLCMTSVCINAISFILRNDYVVCLQNTWLAIHCLLQHPDSGCYNEQSEIAK